MGKIVEFEIGCRRCKHLVRVDKDTWVCDERLHMDDTSVTPIVSGKKTEDWNICDGSDYKMIVRKNRARSS